MCDTLAVRLSSEYPSAPPRRPSLLKMLDSPLKPSATLPMMSSMNEAVGTATRVDLLAKC
eukprot:1493602-Prymnesium_polylepis.1